MLLQGSSELDEAGFFSSNQAQLYVTMSRARKTMHLFTNSIAALREAVCRKSERISALELSAEYEPIGQAVGHIVDLQAGQREGEDKVMDHIDSELERAMVIHAAAYYQQAAQQQEIERGFDR